MSGTQLVSLIDFLEPILCFIVLFAMWRAKVLRTYLYLTLLLSARFLTDLACAAILASPLDKHATYKLLFYVYWSGFALKRSAVPDGRV